MTRKITTDFCVIGAGSGGLSFAAGAVQMGADVVLVEGAKMGGDCLNTGCIPSKALIAAAKKGRHLHSAPEFGWSKHKAKVNFEKVYKHIHDVIRTIEPHDSVERFESLGVHVIQEKGVFKTPDTLTTRSYTIEAKRFIVATGSKPFIPTIPGLNNTPYLTNETIFDLKELPKHLIIIGGGPIGIEMATAFNDLGSKVTVITQGNILSKDDPELVDLLRSNLSEKGVIFLENIYIEGIKNNNGISVTCHYHNNRKHVFNGSHLLIASGRAPNIDDLKLEKADVEYTNRFIRVDKNLRTTNKKIYAIGDCIGEHLFTHMAGYHASIAIKNTIFKLRTTVQKHAVPWVTYTDPELAHVGASEKELLRAQKEFKTLRLNFTENDRAQTEKNTTGMIKVHITKRGKVLGVSILGPHAGELIYPWVILIQNNLHISNITNAIAPYPTFSDINKRVAGMFYTESLFSERMKKIVKFLMSLT